MKLGTTDICRRCKRPIEWLNAPVEFDKDGNVLTPLWKRRGAQWVDVDPPGDDLWNPWCDTETQSGTHDPEHYCTIRTQSGKPCHQRIKEVVDGVHACGRHLAAELQRVERTRQYQERRSFESWENETLENVQNELRLKGIACFEKGAWLPYRVQQSGMIVDVKAVLEIIEDLETQVRAFKMKEEEQYVN